VLASGLAGVKVNAGVGAVRFDGPVNATVMIRERVLAVAAPMGAAEIAMRFAVVEEGGAVTVKVARPLLSVVTSAADSAALEGLAVKAKRCPDNAFPEGSTTVSVTTD
jgi:hypothetical protein